jgi:hypothetical protein
MNAAWEPTCHYPNGCNLWDPTLLQKLPLAATRRLKYHARESNRERHWSDRQKRTQANSLYNLRPHPSLSAHPCYFAHSGMVPIRSFMQPGMAAGNDGGKLSTDGTPLDISGMNLGGKLKPASAGRLHDEFAKDSVSVGQHFAVFASHASVKDLGMSDRANRKSLILRRSRMRRHGVWIATPLRSRIVGHFSVHGMPDVGRVISLCAAVGTGSAPRVTLVPLLAALLGD